MCLLCALALTLTSASHAGIDIGQVTGGSASTVDNNDDPPVPAGVFEELLILSSFVNPIDGTNDLGYDHFQTQNLYAFDESQDVTLTADLSVDMLVDGQGGVAPGILPAGTRLASHFIFFDPKRPRNIEGFVRFDQDILAIITTAGDLSGSDFLGHPLVNYIDTDRGLESDTVTLTAPREVTVFITTGTPGDYIRVVTAVPEPTSLLMASVFAVFLVGAGRRRRNRRTS
jgi:hypothetical protein